MATTFYADRRPSLANPDIAGMRTSPSPKEPGKEGPPTTDAEMLVRALRNVIIPLVRPADGEYKHDAKQDALGLDGEQFVTALEKFMLSFLHQRGPEGGIEVQLEEKGTDILNSESQATSRSDLNISDTKSQTTSDNGLRTEDVAETAGDMGSPPDRSPPEENTGDEGLSPILPISIEQLPDMSVFSIGGSTDISYTDRFEGRESLFIEKVLNALRKHVFDTLPIRLLCFKQDGTKLQITLVERGEMYNYISSRLVDGINFLEVYRDIIHPPESGNPILARFDSWERRERMVIEKLISEYSKYAILSHTWLRGASGEVTYGNWIRSEFDAQQLGYRKLVDFCRIAWKDYGVAFGWMDTICINKESSAELDESIRSMYKWYRDAHVCVTYLAETETLSEMHNDAWFTRGWTLQELLAPSNIKFYNTHWNKLVEFKWSDKYDSIIATKIQEATTITADELGGQKFIPLSRRMQMAAKRQVTREEDRAYCLMGIFDVSMATAYGEGAERAFSRLLQEVFSSPLFGIIDMFNWAGSTNYSRISTLLPSSPQGYLHRSSSLDIRVQWPIEPIMLTHLGLRITVVLMPAILIQNPTKSQYPPFGDYHAIADVSIDPFFETDGILSGSYSVLDASISDGYEENQDQLILGVLNVEAGRNKQIKVPKCCLAVALEPTDRSFTSIGTEAPITFTLNKKGNHNRDEDYYYYIEQNDLDSHGMKLVSIVL